ncbi:hypothetical protein C2G38_2151167 [Gigaspora rosea]|uniref:Uncharacterized protein n=1 Tax=Gigaspora rosea TaxID=44941 RepID=A0A397WAV7_9GLOM|nr:hypothetical protein C2G38_2151167 [Gigaspora rosea]
MFRFSEPEPEPDLNSVQFSLAIKKKRHTDISVSIGTYRLGVEGKAPLELFIKILPGLIIGFNNRLILEVEKTLAVGFIKIPPWSHNHVTLEVGKAVALSFIRLMLGIWKIAETCLNQYAKYYGFSLCCKHVEHDAEGNIRKRTFECSFSGVAVSNKSSATVGITKDIKFYVTKGNMGAKQIYPLLNSKFPEQVLLKQDLYNAIKKFKLPLIYRHGDAQNMVNKLLELKDKEHGWLINTRLDPLDN